MTTKKKFIDAQELMEDSARLAVNILKSGFRPDFIVGVWRGGSPVGIVVQELLDFYFSCSNYLLTSEYFDTFYVSYFKRRGKADLKAKLFCLDPAPMLADRLERSCSTIFFSATLLPVDYFKQLLTGSEDHPAQAFPSPFPRLTRDVLVFRTNPIPLAASRMVTYWTVCAVLLETWPPGWFRYNRSGREKSLRLRDMH